MRALLLWLFLIALGTGAGVALGSYPVWGADPEILARVNGEPVTRADLRRLLQRETSVRVDPDSKERERLALLELIHRQLILQEAVRRNLTITEKEYDQAIAALRGGFLDLGSFGAWMRDQDLDDRSLFAAVRDGMLINRVRAALVEGVRFTEEQVRAFYEARKEELVTPGEVRLRIIAVKEKAEAEALLLALQGGADFSTLARSRSLGKRAATGGDLGWVDPLTLPEPLREGVGELKAGENSGLLQRGAEILIVRLEARRPARRKSLAEARPAIESRLLAAGQEEFVQAWLKERENESKIEVFLQPDEITNSEEDHRGSVKR